MKRVYRTWSLLALLVLLASVPALAATKHPEAMTGLIRKLDRTANTMTVGSLPGMKQHEMTFHVPTTARITRNAQKVAVADLKEGDQVTVEYRKEKGHFTAESIALKPANAEPAMGKPYSP